jgi:membrane associated rhomboid family serine protease
MKSLWQRFTTNLTPGVRGVLILQTVVYLAAIVGALTNTFDLKDWLAASAPEFWHGQVWRIISYALLPTGIMDFLMNAFALFMLGSQLERHWSRGELWRFCVIAAAGAGGAQVLLSSLPLIGASPVMLGLLLGWAFISGHEILPFPVFGEMRVRQMVLILAAVSFAILFFSAGWIRAVVMAAGGLAGWIYLWLRLKWLMSRPSRAVESGRINRLEL